MLKSLMSKLLAVTMLAPQTITATGQSSSIDLEGFGSCMLLVHCGAMAFSGTDKLALKIQHSDDNSSWSDTVAAEVFEGEDMANGVYKYLDAAGDASAIHAAFYLGEKRYVRVSYTESGTVSVPMSVTGIKGHPNAQPQY